MWLVYCPFPPPLPASLCVGSSTLESSPSSLIPGLTLQAPVLGDNLRILVTLLGTYRETAVPQACTQPFNMPSRSDSNYPGEGAKPTLDVECGSQGGRARIRIQNYPLC